MFVRLHGTYYLFNSTTSNPGTTVLHSCIPQSYSLHVRPSFWFTPLILHIYTNIRITAAQVSYSSPQKWKAVSYAPFSILPLSSLLCCLFTTPLSVSLSVSLSDCAIKRLSVGIPIYHYKRKYVFFLCNIMPIPGSSKLIHYLLALGNSWLFCFISINSLKI